jgi:hypothetical protein
MTKISEDDVTGEQTTKHSEMVEFGFTVDQALYAGFEVHEDTLQDDPEAVAEKLHSIVDDWEESQKEANEKYTDEDREQEMV